MILVSKFQAAALSTLELTVLRKEAFIAFSCASRGSLEQRNALATMGIVEAELAVRTPAP